jgi:hypothetical protein
LAAFAMHGAGKTNTAPATIAQLGRYERQAIEEAAARGETLAPEEAGKRARFLLKANMSRLSLAASRARARKAGVPPESVR